MSLMRDELHRIPAQMVLLITAENEQTQKKAHTNNLIPSSVLLWKHSDCIVYRLSVDSCEIFIGFTICNLLFGSYRWSSVWDTVYVRHKTDCRSCIVARIQLHSHTHWAMMNQVAFCIATTEPMLTDQCTK